MELAYLKLNVLDLADDLRARGKQGDCASGQVADSKLLPINVIHVGDWSGDAPGDEWQGVDGIHCS